MAVSYSELLPTQMTLWATADAGLFARHGLDVTVELIESTPGMAAAIAGQTQIAMIGGGAPRKPAARRADIVVLANVSPVYPFVFQVAPAIRSVEDLRGQRVGVSRYGSASDIATRVALGRVGLDPDRDVSIIQVGSATARRAAMLAGNIVGGVVQPPDTLALESEGFQTLFDLAALNLPAASSVLTAQRGYVAANRDAVQRFVDAFMEGIALVKRDRPYAIGLLKQYLKNDDEIALNVAYDYFTEKIIVDQPYPRAEHFADAVAQLAETNPAVRDFNMAGLLDASFVQSAVERGVGRR
jgi:ABC-type nitrate/sulfonate/bicarbonate transport system substrate-binding protein